ncbi:FAD-dependent oxidoreductase [Paenibacillus albidus]|uniref:NAD(P)/FAD-dependent oxidoreductase n=1 Tax=Paenibacillus albidus TaxID=2041023 RepID=UPI001BEB53FA|nr:FAD-dependent oxidoreductase [Paenibacillus albidus]MBT2288632.1 FAD-dependent oxidoreductase [Paenibacillus albidus]
MNLNSGNTPWQKTLEPVPSYPLLEGDIRCDCLIVGGGTSGAMTAYRLSASGADVVVIDKRTLGGGSSQANTGLLQVSNDKPLTSCIHTFGEAQGVLFYKLCQASLRNILKLQDKLDIDPRIHPCSSLLYASTAEDIPLLRQEHETLLAFGFDSEFWEKDRISSVYSFSKAAGLYSRGDAVTNPLRLLHGLMAKAASQGVRVYEHTEAKHYEFKDDGVICYTGNGRIFAKKVIFALGYETQEMKKDKGALLVNTYAIMTRPLPELPKWHERSLVWETARPYLYFRITPDLRIIAGGRDEPLTDPERREKRILTQGQRLLEDLQALFPEIQDPEIEFAWGSVFGTTHDGLPYIGAHPRFPHCYFIEGYGGNGTVYSMIAAELLSDTLAGKHRAELDLFSLTRSSKPSPPADPYGDITATI